MIRATRFYGNEDYQLLVREGHSAQMAAQIVLDAKRKDSYAQRWIKILRSRDACLPKDTYKNVSKLL